MLKNAARMVAIKRYASLAACAAMVMAPGFANAGSNTYKYDALGRLIEVIASDGADTTFTYDAAGNRTVEKTAGVKVASPSVPAGTSSVAR